MASFITHKAKRIAVVAAALLGLGGGTADALVILPTGSTVEGQTIAEWTEDWWTWVYQSPVDANPLLDDDGDFANVNNDGPVFFVAGTESGAVTREFSVPGGRPILLPLLNAIGYRESDEVLDNLVATFPNIVTDLFASIDGEAVEDLRDHLEVTGVFSMGLVQPGSLIEARGETVGTELAPSRAVGYWLMIDDLEPGPHTLHFGGALAFDGFELSTGTTAEILVPEPAALGLLGFGILAMAGLRRRT